MKNTKRIMSVVGLFFAVAAPSFAQRVGGFPMPRTVPTYHPAPAYHPPAQTYHPPAAPRSTSSAQTSRSASQTSSRPAQTQSRPAQSVPQHSTASAPQSRPATTESRPQAASRPQAPPRKEVQKQQKAEARQQKEQQKQNQKQQKEQKKLQQKQQKEEARQQKELQKQQKNNKKLASSAKESKARPASPAVAKASTGSRASAGASTASGSPARLQQLNANRSNLSGINRKPLPTGELTVHPNGRMTLKAEGGRQYGLRSNGTIASYSDRQETVSFDQRGKVSSIHTANMDIHNGPHGQRTIVSRGADGSKVVSTSRHSGYVERNVVMNNRTYVERTTIINHHVFTRIFVANGFGGLALVPPVFFAPGFYGWAYYPWASPIAFRWGWFGAPWYVGPRYIGPNPYFVASPLYPSAAFWLTDYMIGETLATAYQLHHDASDEMANDMSDDDNTVADNSDAGTSDANAGMSSDQDTVRAGAATPITPELKAEIAEEVKQQLANDNAEARNPDQASFDMLPAALSTPNHVFVVSSDLDVTTTDQQLCALQAGDMLQLMSPAAGDSTFVQVRVASSKRMDCPGGVLVNVSLPDLQEMQNSFQAHVEAGLSSLQHGQGSAGLPVAPPEAVAAPPRPAVTGLSPVSGPESSTMIDQQGEQADQAEAQADSGSF